MTGRLPRIYRITDPVVEAVVFHGLPGADPEPAINGDWRPSLRWMVNQRLAGAALDLVKTHSVELPDDVHDVLVQARKRERARTMLADLSAARVTEVMTGAGIPFVVVKGPAMAALDPVPGARPYLDVDIVVAPDRFSDAMAAARVGGFESNTERPARAYYERYCYEGVNLRDAQNRAIDIHHHVPPWWAGRKLTLDLMARDATTGSVAGMEMPFASATSNLLIAALHLVSDQNMPGFKLLSWRDVMLTCSVAEPDRIVAATRATGLGWWLHWVLEQMPHTARTAEVMAALSRTGDVRPPRTGAARIKALSASADSGMNLAFAARLPAPNAAAYVAGQVLPTKQARALRLHGDESLIGWWRYVGRSFTGRPHPAAAPAAEAPGAGARTPELVVGLPVFNGMPYLPEAIESLRAQTVSEFRCIVIDDGSTDGTAEYLDALDDDRFTVVHQPNRGLVATLNRILDMCPPGSWLVRHDADDIATPDRLATVIPLLRDGVSLVHTAADYLGSPGGHLRFRSSPMSGDQAAGFVRSGRLLSVCHPSAIINVDMCRHVGGYRDLRRVEDLDLWWRLALEGDVVFVPTVTVSYRVSEAGVSHSALRRQAVHALYVQYLLLSELRGIEPLPFAEVEAVLDAMHDDRELRFRSHIRDAQIAYQSRRSVDALRLLVRSMQASPRSFTARVRDELRHRFNAAAPVGSGVAPERFERFASALWPQQHGDAGPGTVELPSGRRALQVTVLDVEVVLVDGETLTQEVVALVGRGDRALVSNHNLHSLALRQEHPDLAGFDELATFSFIDGMSLVALGRLKGLPMRRSHRTTYFDWAPLLFAQADARGWTIAHVGCEPETNMLAADHIAQRYPSIEVVHHHGFFDVDSPTENAEVLAWLEQVQPDLLLVGMSMPRQERWIRDNWDALPKTVVLNSGGFFALLGGEQAVPPRWLGQLGLEWLGRLMLNPRRTWRRYLVEPVHFLAKRDLWR